MSTEPLPEYQHTTLFPLGEDTTPYRKLTSDFVATEKFNGSVMVTVQQEGIRLLAETALADINHLLRPGHLRQLRKILGRSRSN